MINWQSLIFNSFWILGLATILAALSYGYWIADQHGQSMRTHLGGRGFCIPFWIAIFLIGIGLAGTSSQFWESIIWLVFSIVSVAFLANLIRK